MPALDSPQMSPDVPTRLVWTDSDGFVHERKPNADVARCGATYEGESHRWTSPHACQPCIDDALREYALAHDCKASGCLKAAQGDRDTSPRR